MKVKTDFWASVGVAIIGTIVAFLVCNLFLGEIESVTFKTVGGDVATDLATPDENVFNFNALNPTVEVYVGEE